MSNELCKRLRILAGMTAMAEPISFGSDSSAMTKAAARIEQQAAEIERLRAQLEDRVHDC